MVSLLPEFHNFRTVPVTYCSVINLTFLLVKMGPKSA